jgi:serine phosphatase RsbU (regulator of sigma subunit)/putative methionine-R-sulfoxide reductase with GAF domain/anti-sigma regulatory factor (Ser/Thr protein kinase)
MPPTTHESAGPPQGPELVRLQRVTDAALAHLSLDRLLLELLDRMTELLDTDTAAFLMLDEDTNELVARAAKGIEEEVEQGVRIPVGRGFAGRIAAERRAIALADVDHAEIHNPILREKGIKSLLGVPLLVEGRVSGVLHVGTLHPRAFSHADQQLLQLAADRAATAIENARLYEAEKSARMEADRTAARLQALQRVTDAALSYLSPERLLLELLDRMTELLHTDTAAFLMLDEPAGELVARAAKGIEEEVEQRVRIPLGKGFAGRVAAQRRPIALEDVEHADIHNPILRQKGIKSLLGVPLLVEGRVIGVLHVGTLTPRIFTAEDVELLQLAGDRAGMAIDNATRYAQRGLVEALQRSLLPEPLPDVPGIRFAARYVPSAEGRSIGGDWYDAFPLGDGRIALAIGDVMGRGVEAAVLMAQLRTALRAYTLDGHEPAAVAERLNRTLVPGPSGRMTTLAHLVFEPETGMATMISAGHVPPLVVGPDGTAEYVAVEGDPPLGVSRIVRYTERTFEIPAGSRLVLVTDGAVEVRTESLDAGLGRLRELAERVSDPWRLSAAVAAGEVIGRPPADDLAVLVMQVDPLPDQLSTRWPATTTALAPMRQLVRRWLYARGATEHEVYDLVVAVQEASANAIEHAYGLGAAEFQLEASYADGVVTFTIRDQGQWRAPRGTNRGRGLPMMRALADSVDVRSTAEGTTVELRRELGAG